MNRKAAGILYGSIGAVCYGTNPLFALHMYGNGYGANSVLFYRYFTAVIIFGLWSKFIKKVSLKIEVKEILPLCIAALMFSLSSLALFHSYSYIDGGIASVILFIYPIFVAIIMALFFKEKISLSTLLSILLVSFGVFLLYKGKNGQNLNLTGLFLVIVSALSYAVYMVLIKKNNILNKMKTEKLTFYIMLFGLSVFIYNLNFLQSLQTVSSPVLWFDILMLAILPTIVAIDTLNISIKMIGPTLSAVVSALEPVSAMIFCVVFFHEEITIKIIFGIIVILSAVFIVVPNKKTKRNN